MISPQLKTKIRDYYAERIQFARENNIGEAKHMLTYKLVFTNHKGYVGQCHYSKKEIRISELHNQYATWESIKDTINHEIAHWLAPAGSKHGPVWQKLAVQMGAAPETKVEVGGLQKPYLITCHGEIVGYSDVFRTGEDATGRYMKGKKRQTLGNLVWKPNPNFIDNSKWTGEPAVETPAIAPVKPARKINSTIADFLNDL